MSRKKISVEDIPDEIEILANEQMQTIAHDLAEINKAAESCGYSTQPDSNRAIMVRAKAIESNAMSLALMMQNPRGYLQDVVCYEIEG